MLELDSVEVLLVEDSPTDAELSLLALKQDDPNLRICWVQDGAEALDFMFCRGRYAGRAARAPRLVLLDLKIPKLDGIEVLRALKADTSTYTVPIVVLTSSAEERDIAEVYRSNVNSYIVKPLDFDRYLEVVSQACHYWVRYNQLPA